MNCMTPNMQGDVAAVGSLPVAPASPTAACSHKVGITTRYTVIIDRNSTAKTPRETRIRELAQGHNYPGYPGVSEQPNNDLKARLRHE